MLAYLRNESGASVVEARLRDPDVTCCAHAINLCEVYYNFIRDANVAVAAAAITALFSGGVIERSDMDSAFSRRVGQHKARGHISLADCCCHSPAERLAAQVVTSDHKGFDP